MPIGLAFSSSIESKRFTVYGLSPSPLVPGLSPSPLPKPLPLLLSFSPSSCVSLEPVPPVSKLSTSSLLTSSLYSASISNDSS